MAYHEPSAAPKTGIHLKQKCQCPLDLLPLAVALALAAALAVVALVAVVSRDGNPTPSTPMQLTSKSAAATTSLSGAAKMSPSTTSLDVETVHRREYTYFGPQLNSAIQQQSEVCARAFLSQWPPAADRSQVDLNKCDVQPGVPPYSKDSWIYAFLKGGQIWLHQWTSGVDIDQCPMNKAHDDYFLGNLNGCAVDYVVPNHQCECNDIRNYLKAFPSNPCGAVYKIDKKRPWDPYGKCKCGSINGKRCGKITASWWGNNPPKTPLNY